jgi:hypothetical protein
MSIETILSIDERGNKWWKLNGELHREDGPAIEYTNGYKAWYLNGKLHREDGPAISYPSGIKHWCLNGKYYDSQTDWFQTLTPEQQYNYLWSLDVSST